MIDHPLLGGPAAFRRWMLIVRVYAIAGDGFEQTLTPANSGIAGVS
jgi:hypothetical protein